MGIMEPLSIEGQDDGSKLHLPARAQSFMLLTQMLDREGNPAVSPRARVSRNMATDHSALLTCNTGVDETEGGVASYGAPRV